MTAMPALPFTPNLARAAMLAGEAGQASVVLAVALGAPLGHARERLEEARGTARRAGLAVDVPRPLDDPPPQLMSIALNFQEHPSFAWRLPGMHELPEFGAAYVTFTEVGKSHQHLTRWVCAFRRGLMVFDPSLDIAWIPLASWVASNRIEAWLVAHSFERRDERRPRRPVIGRAQASA